MCHSLSVFSSNIRSYMLEGLKGGTPYTAKISVGNSIGFGPAKEIKFFTVRPGYPAMPTFVRTSDVGSTSVKLSWTVVDVGRPYTEYCISAAVVEEGGSSGAEGEVFTVDAKDVQVIGDEESTEVYILSHHIWTCTYIVRYSH